jgi:Protein of unknown function (DUF3999)
LKSALLFALILWQTTPQQPVSATAAQQYFRYQRTITLPADLGPVCVVLDPQLFPHAAPSLKDLRLYQDIQEIPYAITLSEPQQPDSDTAQIRNLGLRNRNIVFDLEMPPRPYTDVVLNLAGQNFLATATVSGTRDSNYANQTHLGEFTLFDLTSQHLSRSTTLHLQETDLPFLHVELSISPTPNTPSLSPQALQQMVQSATVPPSREAQSLYTTAATSKTITQRNKQTIASFNLSERIPIERVSVDLAPTFKANFSRDIHITDHPTNTTDTTNETLAGTILRVHLTESGREIRQQQLSVPATLGSNMQSPATVQIAIDNGDDPPLPITAIRLEARQRKLCFDAPTTQPLTLFYGDNTLPAPRYDYARLFTPTSTFHTAQLSPEQSNPTYRARPDARPLTERRPHLLWILLLVVIGILAITAIRSSKTVHH